MHKPISKKRKTTIKQELLLTQDGSHTLQHKELDECYHSIHGAIMESRHVFIDAGLRQCHPTELSVLEVGFGTGLNAYLTLLEAAQHQLTIHYQALERYPVDLPTATSLNYPALLGQEESDVFYRMHIANWNDSTQITEGFTLEKREVDFTQCTFNRRFDLIYFDAFSPEKQSEMWTAERFRLIYNHCNEGAVLTTYCAKGAVRRAMQQAGFMVERIAGPPGKREMLRARVVKSL